MSSFWKEILSCSVWRLQYWEYWNLGYFSRTGKSFLTVSLSVWDAPYIYMYPGRLSVLRGENKAALEVAKRTGIAVDQGARYEQYGMSEEVLWERVAEMDEWWRESTWSALFPLLLPRSLF